MPGFERGRSSFRHKQCLDNFTLSNSPFVRAPNQGAAGGHQRHRVNQPLKYLSKDGGEAHLPGQFLLQRSKSDLRE